MRTSQELFESAIRKLKSGDRAGLQDLDEALMIEPDNSLYLWERARLHYDREDFALAIKDLKDIVALYLRDLDEAFQTLAYCYQAIGQEADFLESLEWLIRNGRATASQYAWQAKHLYEDGQVLKAIERISTACEMAPQVPESVITRARMYYSARKYDEALAYVNSLLEPEKNLTASLLSVVYHWRGKIQYQQGDEAQALIDFNEGRRLKGEPPVSSAAEYMEKYYGGLMLNRESQRLDLQEIGIPEQAIEIDTQGMGCELGEKPGAQPPKGMGVIDLNVELLDQLTIDGLDDLPDGIEGFPNGRWRLVGLVTSRQGHEFEAVVLEQLPRQIGADVALVAKDSQIGVFGQQFSTHRQIRGTGRSQFKIQNQPAQSDQQMQFETENGDFLAGTLAIIGPVRRPIAGRTGH